MINRDSRGRPYSIVRGEILGFIEDELLRRINQVTTVRSPAEADSDRPDRENPRRGPDRAGR